jgi:hypothetical protein
LGDAAYDQDRFPGPPPGAVGVVPVKALNTLRRWPQR